MKPEPIISVSCGWCHEMNEIRPGQPNYCMTCAHRSDLPRMECNCVYCSLSPEERTKIDAGRAATIEELEAYFARRKEN